MRIQIFQIKCSEWGWGQAEPWKHIRFIPLVLFTGPRNIGCKQNANSFDWIRWCRGNCIWRNVQDFFFFSLLLSMGEGFFMKFILNKSYHHSQALWCSFVICGCGCAFNFLSIKSKYAVFFFLPPPTVKSKQEESTWADRWRIFILLLSDSTGSVLDGIFSRNKLIPVSQVCTYSTVYVWPLAMAL